MEKYCEIIDGKVNWILPEGIDTADYADLNLCNITDKVTENGSEIIPGCYYDSLHDAYFHYECEYKDYKEMILLYLEDLSIENNRLNKEILLKNNEILKFAKEIKNLEEKIDSLAKLIIFLAKENA